MSGSVYATRDGFEPPNGNGSGLAVLIIIPLIFSFLLMYGVSKFEGEVYDAVRWFAYLLVFPLVWMSFNFSVIFLANVFPAWTEITNGVLTSLTVGVWVFWTLTAVGLTLLIRSIFLAIKIKKQKDFERGKLR